MATRAGMNLQGADIVTREVAATKSVTKGYVVKLSGADDKVENCEAGDSGFGVALETGAAGAKVQIALLCGAVRLKVVVGTGDATRDTFLTTVANGVTDVATLGGGTTAVEVVLKALESGVAGDEIAAIPALFTGVTS